MRREKAAKPRSVIPIRSARQRRTYFLDRNEVVDHRTGKRSSEAKRIIDGELELIK